MEKKAKENRVILFVKNVMKIFSEEILLFWLLILLNKEKIKKNL